MGYRRVYEAKITFLDEKYVNYIDDGGVRRFARLDKEHLMEGNIYNTLDCAIYADVPVELLVYIVTVCGKKYECLMEAKLTETVERKLSSMKDIHFSKERYADLMRRAPSRSGVWRLRDKMQDDSKLSDEEKEQLMQIAGEEFEKKEKF